MHYFYGILAAVHCDDSHDIHNKLVVVFINDSFWTNPLGEE